MRGIKQGSATGTTIATIGNVISSENPFAKVILKRNSKIFSRAGLPQEVHTKLSKKMLEILWGRVGQHSKDCRNEYRAQIHSIDKKSMDCSTALLKKRMKKLWMFA